LRSTLSVNALYSITPGKSVYSSVFSNGTNFHLIGSMAQGGGGSSVIAFSFITILQFSAIGQVDTRVQLPLGDLFFPLTQNLNWYQRMYHCNKG
jgi:hypothetical protein